MEKSVKPRAVGDFVVFTKEEFEPYKKAYDSYLRRNERSRIHMNAKYQKNKLQNKKKELESKDLTDEEVAFILEHTN